MSFGVSAAESILNCQEGPLRVPNTLEAFKIPGGQVMVIQKNHFSSPIYFFGSKSIQPAHVYTLNKETSYELTDLDGNEVTLDVVEKVYHGRAGRAGCSMRAGNCNHNTLGYGPKTAILISADSDDVTYQCL